jgi:hypothetical protein
MTTSELTSTYLTFDDGVTQYARITAAADVFNFAGAGGVNTVLLTNLTNPLAAQDAATKNYVDNLVNGLSWKNEVAAATTADTALSSVTTVVDGVTIVDGMRILVKEQVAQIENGIYIAKTAPATSWVRSDDMPVGSEAIGDATFVGEGTANGSKSFVCNSVPSIVGTDDLTFVVLTSSIPSAGGSNTQLQYNNAGALGGMSNWTTADSGITLSAATGTLTLDATSTMNLATTTVTYDPTPNALMFNDTGGGMTHFYGTDGYRFKASNDDGYTSYFMFDSDSGVASVTNNINNGVLTSTFNGTNSVINSTAGNLNLTSALGDVNVTGNGNVFITATTSNAIFASTIASATVIGDINADLTATTGTATLSGATTAVTSTTNAVTVTGATGVSVVNQSATNPTIMKLGDAAGVTEFRVNDSADVNQFKVDSDGKGTFVGNVYGLGFYATSDVTLKTNIESLSNPLDKLSAIEGYQYNWKDQNADQELQFGVIAQQLEEAGLGHLVSENNGHKTVNYIGLIPLLIGAVKELSKKVDNLV